MSKVIAVFEKPTHCEDCPCSYYTEGTAHDFCQLAGYHTEINYRGSGQIPDWCPLIEIAYECDKDECENGCNNQDCFHTTDIDHAVNFNKLCDGKYMEKRRNF